MNDACLIAARIPLEAELEESLGSFLRLRWLAAGTIVAAGAWRAGAGADAGPLLAIGAGVLAYNVLFLLEVRRERYPPGREYRRQVHAQMALDWAALAFLIHFTGGLRSPVALAFAPHVIIGAMLLSSRAAAAQSGAAAAVLGLLALSEAYGWWPPVDVTGLDLAAGHDATGLLGRWVVLSLFLGVVSALTRSLVLRLRQKEQALVDSEVRRERAFRSMEALYELGQVAHATLELPRVLALIAESATRLTGMKACSISLLDDSGEVLLPGAAYGLSDGYLAKGPVQVARSAMVAQALAGQVVQVEDTAADGRLQYPDRARQEGIGAIVCVGLHLRDRPIGVLRVYAAEPRPILDAQVGFLRNLANLAAVAIENARAYAESQALAEERAWFARTTHHQLRAPLAVMRGLLEALPYAGDLNPKQTELVARATRRVDELLALVGDLLDLAYAQRPALHLEPVPVALAAVLAPVLEAAAERAGQKGVDLAATGLEGAVAAAEAEDVRRIFANLLDNAVKYTPAGGRVRLQAQRRAGFVRVEVHDTGIGVDAQDRDRIFRGFYRSEAARATAELGTGVGLTIVQRLVRRWRGRVDLDSSPGAGSCFTVTLPAATAPAGTAEDGDA